MNKRALFIGSSMLLVAAAFQAHAQTAPTYSGVDGSGYLAQRLDQMEAQLQHQQSVIDQQQQELAKLRAQGQADTGALDSLRAGGLGDATGQGTLTVPASTTGPVGQAPPAPQPNANLNNALPADNTGVLTRPGHWVLEPSIAYSLSSSNFLVFEGVEIVTGIQVGVIEANTAQRNTGIFTGTARYGLTDRSEIEVRVPFIYRRDLVTTLQQQSQAVSSSFDLNAANIGDIEMTGRYQLNSGSGGWPVMVGNVRIKSDTGTDPYTVQRDPSGVALKLATGSGFWAVEPSISFLFPSDPVVLFGNISYLHNFPRTFNRNVGDAIVGRVIPGDSPGITGGFGFSLNSNASFSLGYRHNYIFGTTTYLSGTKQRSQSLQVGSLLFGMAYAVNNHFSLNTQLELGATRDAPDVTLTLRTPITF